MEKSCIKCKYFENKGNTAFCKKLNVSLLVSSKYVCKNFEAKK